MYLRGREESLKTMCWDKQLRNAVKTRWQQKGFLFVRGDTPWENLKRIFQYQWNLSEFVIMRVLPVMKSRSEFLWVTAHPPPATHILPTCVGVNKHFPVRRDVTHQTGRAIKEPRARTRRVCSNYDIRLYAVSYQAGTPPSVGDPWSAEVIADSVWTNFN